MLAAYNHADGKNADGSSGHLWKALSVLPLIFLTLQKYIRRWLPVRLPPVRAVKNKRGKTRVRGRSVMSSRPASDGTFIYDDKKLKKLRAK